MELFENLEINENDDITKLTDDERLKIVIDDKIKFHDLNAELNSYDSVKNRAETAYFHENYNESLENYSKLLSESTYFPELSGFAIRDIAEGVSCCLEKIGDKEGFALELSSEIRKKYKVENFEKLLEKILKN